MKSNKNVATAAEQLKRGEESKRRTESLSSESPVSSGRPASPKPQLERQQRSKVLPGSFDSGAEMHRTHSVSAVPGGEETDTQLRLLRNEQLLNSLHAEVQTIQRGQAAVISTMRHMTEQMTKLMQATQRGHVANTQPFSSLNKPKKNIKGKGFPEIQDHLVSPESFCSFTLPDEPFRGAACT